MDALTSPKIVFQPPPEATCAKPAEGAWIRIVRSLDAVADDASVTRAVKVYDPTVVGVPLMVPNDVFKESPGGSAPPTADQLTYGGTPPVAASVCEYGEPIDPVGIGEAVVTANVDVDAETVS